MLIAWIPCYHVKMIVSFKNQATEDIFNGICTKNTRKTCPDLLLRVTTRKLDQLDSVINLDELNIPPGNRLEKLTGNRKETFSVRINNQYRICFKWGESGLFDVEITDYH